jgi:hypothetical protein
MFAPRLSLVPSPRGDHAPIAALEGIGDRELPDATMTEERRGFLKDQAREFKAGLSPVERVYVASFLEDDALREWAEEESRRA